MENILFKIIGNGMVNDELVQVIKDKLLEKHQKTFEITKLGRRFGTYTNDTVSAVCHESKNDSLKFTCILNRDRVHFEDDYCIRSICYEIECAFKEEFQKYSILIFPKVNIIGKEKFDKIISVQEFVNIEKNTKFLVEVYVKDNISEKVFGEIVNSIRNKYKNIKLRLITYILNEKYFQDIIDDLKELPGTEDFDIDENELKNKFEIRIIENNLIR